MHRLQTNQAMNKLSISTTAASLCLCQHTCAAGAERAKRLRKAPPTRGSWMHGVLGIKNALNARYERKDWESFFDNESEFVIVDNQFG